MSRGRKPEPAGVREQKEPVRSRQRPKPPLPDAALAAGGVLPPAWLKKDGLKVWNRLAPTLRAAKLLTSADSETFGRYCRNFARWLKLQQDLDKTGEAYESESQWGKLRRVNPSFLISDRLERMLLATEDRFGLNPAERQRIFAARAQTGISGDLFGAQPSKQQPEKREGDPAADPAAPAAPEEGPVGFLN